MSDNQLSATSTGFKGTYWQRAFYNSLCLLIQYFEYYTETVFIFHDKVIFSCLNDFRPLFSLMLNLHKWLHLPGHNWKRKIYKGAFKQCWHISFVRTLYKFHCKTFTCNVIFCYVCMAFLYFFNNQAIFYTLVKFTPLTSILEQLPQNLRKPKIYN